MDGKDVNVATETTNKMGLKSILKRVLFVLIHFAVLYALWFVGIRALIGYAAGIFTGACVVLWWAYSKNPYMTGVLAAVMEKADEGTKGRNKK